MVLDRWQWLRLFSEIALPSVNVWLIIKMEKQDYLKQINAGIVQFFNDQLSMINVVAALTPTYLQKCNLSEQIK